MMARKRLNTVDIVLRALAGAVGLFFLVLGIGFLTLPEVFATGFYAEPARAVGINAIRGDFGALFLGMSFFCLLGTLTVHRRLLIVPAVFLTLIIAGRLTSLLVDDVPNLATGSVVMEWVFLAILVLAVVTASVNKDTVQKDLAVKDFFNFKTIMAFTVIVMIIGIVFLSQKKIGMILLNVIGKRFSSLDVVGDLPDGLHVGLSGAGSPLTDAKRACPGVFVIAGKRLYLVDTGSGSTRKFELMKLQPGKIEAVLLTHFHSDHIGELGELMLKRWAGGSRPEPLQVYGPRGVETVVKGFNMAYSLDSAYRVAHHGPQIMPPAGAGGDARPFDFPAGKQEVVIIAVDDLKVTAFLVDHRPVEPAVGYRFDYRGRSLVISGDTLPCESLRHQARGVDLLMHEALQPTMVRALSNLNMNHGRTNIARITSDISAYHTFPEEAARIAAEAGVQHLVFYHIIPPLPVAVANATFLGDAKKYFKGPITVGEDGMLFSMPSESRAIHKKWLLR